MKIYSIQANSYNNTHKTISSKNKNDSNNVSFEGLNINKIFKNTAKEKYKQRIRKDFCYEIGRMLGTKTSDIISLTEGVNKNRMTFLNTLAKHYNIRNFNLDKNLKEDTTPLIEIFKLVTKPDISHSNIVKKSEAPFETILKLFQNAGEKKGLEFIETMQNHILDGSKKSADLIIKMLASKNRNEYIKNIKNYSSYLKLNANKEDAIEILDELIAKNQYKKSKYDAKYAVKNFYLSYPQNMLPHKAEFLEQNYSKEGIKILKLLHKSFPYDKVMSSEGINDMLDIYKTTNPENYLYRKDIINEIFYSVPIDERYTKEIKPLKELFHKMDADKNAIDFVQKIMDDNVQIERVHTLNNVLDIVPASKAKIFHKNIARIIKYTNKEERAKALINEIENPFFITKGYAQQLENSIKYGFSKKESKISKLARLVENKINQIKYNRIKNSVESEVVTNTATKTEEKMATAQPENLIPVIEAKIDNDTPKIELKRVFKESPQARKLRVQKDVNEIIKQKLGQKTYERQQEAYKNDAMVMRLKLLPEIFESIKETRKLQKASGLKPRVETRDAIKLYSRINGKNRKLVNYMLKQTDLKGERIFDIKDIIKCLDAIETKIAKTKEQNHNFKANDAKAIYNYEYDIMLFQHGKLRRLKKKTK